MEGQNFFTKIVQKITGGNKPTKTKISELRTPYEILKEREQRLVAMRARQESSPTYFPPEFKPEASRSEKDKATEDRLRVELGLHPKNHVDRKVERDWPII